MEKSRRKEKFESELGNGNRESEGVIFAPPNLGIKEVITEYFSLVPRIEQNKIY